MVLVKDTAVSVAGASQEGGVGIQLSEPQGRGNVAEEMCTSLRVPVRAGLQLRKRISYINVAQAIMYEWTEFNRFQN